MGGAVVVFGCLFCLLVQLKWERGWNGWLDGWMGDGGYLCFDLFRHFHGNERVFFCECICSCLDFVTVFVLLSGWWLWSGCVLQV
jgi:hypothetical protein